MLTKNNVPIDFTVGHMSAVIGTTGSGKTYGMTESLLRDRRGVLFFNTLDVDVNKSYIEATENTDVEVFKKALLKGDKINYRPSYKINEKQDELVRLIDYIYSLGKDLNIIMAIDEVHLFEKRAKDRLVQLATTGRNFNVYGVFCSQAPQTIDNRILRMCEQWVIYYITQMTQYFKTYNLPAEEIENMLKEATEYSYLTYNFREIKGMFKV